MRRALFQKRAAYDVRTVNTLRCPSQSPFLSIPHEKWLAAQWHPDLRRILWLRTALKVLVPIHSFRARTDKDLYNGVFDFAWEEVFDAEKFEVENVMDSSAESFVGWQESAEEWVSIINLEALQQTCIFCGSMC